MVVGPFWAGNNIYAWCHNKEINEYSKSTTHCCLDLSYKHCSTLPGHNSLSRPKSLLISSPSTKLLSLEEAQARTQAQINSPVTEDSKYIEVGEGPAALQGKFHTVIEFPTERFVGSFHRDAIKKSKSRLTHLDICLKVPILLQ